MAPTSASDIATFMPANIAGKAVGKRTFQSTWSGVARIDLVSSRTSGSTERSQSTVSITIANNAISIEIATLELVPVPIQMMNSGASAIFGIEFSETSSV